MKKFISWFDKKSKDGWVIIDTETLNLKQVFEKITKILN